MEKLFQDNAGITKYGDTFGYGANANSLNGRKWYGKSGNLLSFTSYYVRFPEEETVIIILLNTWFPVNDQLKTIISAIVMGEPYLLPAQKKEILLDNTILQKYAGTYECDNDTFIHLKTSSFMQLVPEGNYLVDKETEGYVLKFVPLSDTKFYLKGLEFLECQLETDRKGNVTGLTLTNGTEKEHFQYRP